MAPRSKTSPTRPAAGSASRPKIVSDSGRQKKHGNRIVETADGKFHSVRELRRWHELKLLARAGLVENLSRQTVFVLAPSVRIKGRLRPPLRYVADFTYRDTRTGAQVVEDAKGHITDAYRIKRHLMATVHGVEILET